MLLVDGGRAVAGLCYVENLIDAAVLALGHEAAPGQAFNVTDGLDVTWRQFTDDLAEGLGCATGPLEPALPDRQRRRLLARAGLPAAAPHDRLQRPRRCSRDRPCRCWAAIRTSATAERARRSAGSRAWTTRRDCGKRSPGCAQSTPSTPDPSSACRIADARDAQPPRVDVAEHNFGCMYSPICFR